MADENEVCKYCDGTGWVNVKNADGTEGKRLCYCHPLVRSGKIKALGGSYYLTKYMKLEQSKRKRKRGNGNVSK